MWTCMCMFLYYYLFLFLVLYIQCFQWFYHFAGGNDTFICSTPNDFILYFGTLRNVFAGDIVVAIESGISEEIKGINVLYYPYLFCIITTIFIFWFYALTFSWFSLTYCFLLFLQFTSIICIYLFLNIFDLFLYLIFNFMVFYFEVFRNCLVECAVITW